MTHQSEAIEEYAAGRKRLRAETASAKMLAQSMLDGVPVGFTLEDALTLTENHEHLLGKKPRCADHQA